MQMKKITAFLYRTSIGITLLLSAACKKMLDIPANAPGGLVTGQVFSDSTTAVNAVVGMYISAFASGGPLSQYMSLYPSLSSDDITSPLSLDFSNNALVAGGDSNPGGSAGNIWNGFYNNILIYQANAAIEGLTASANLSPALKDQLIGECEMVRALSYFYLVNLYGPVPVAISTDYLVNGKLPRAPVDTVYAQIIKDLVDAGNRMKAAYPSNERARPNKYTAMALLSRVYLYQQKWSLAEATADAIINSGDYSLEALDHVFVMGNQEVIWQAVSVGFYGYETQEGQTFVPYAPDIIPQYYLTTHLLDAFEPGDQRKSQWTALNNVNGADYYYPYKYKNRQTVQIDGRVEGEVLFRLAEQYLIRAEASIQLGDLNGGAKDIDMIRNRAGLPNTTAASNEDLLTAIARERQTEFFCEWGHRWLDLKRTGTINTVMTQEKGDIWPADGHAALYPVPYDQFKLNPGWQQNPGY
jgi:hypothetical protein